MQRRMCPVNSRDDPLGPIPMSTLGQAGDGADLTELSSLAAAEPHVAAFAQACFCPVLDPVVVCMHLLPAFLPHSSIPLANWSMLQMLRDDVGASTEAEGIQFVSVCQSALRECARQEKAVALPMLLTLQTTIQVGPLLFRTLHMVPLCSLRSHV